MISLAFFFVFVGVATAAPSLDNRIVGGEVVNLGEYSYIVSLQKNGRHSCGGSILSENFVLTAAHCIAGYETNPESLTIQYGVTNLNSDENKIIVKRVIKKSDYVAGNGYLNDVAVLELSEKMKLGPNAKPVTLPNADSYPGDNATAVLVGWGRTATNDPISKELLKVEIVLFTDEFCESKETDYNAEKHVCAGVPQGGHGQCSGDSGGPLTVNGVQYGIVSWSVKPCASFGHPGVFASVVAFRDWIRENSGV